MTKIDMSKDVPWPSHANIVEVDPPNGGVSAHLTSRGYIRHLCVVRDSKARAALIESSPELAPHVVAVNGRARIQRNNADVLILHGRAALWTAYLRAYRHAEWVVVPVRPNIFSCVAMVMALIFWAFRRLESPTLMRLGDAGMGTTRIGFRVRRRRGHNGPRRYIPHQLGVERFFEELRNSSIQYAVLRWFETLPDVPPGEDIDLLVADGSLDAIREILASGPGVQPVDVYSVTGLPGSDHRGMPYFPPRLAQQLLDSSCLRQGLYSVPAPSEHFFSLAYHALYHKGESSGLASERAGRYRRTRRPDHDYRAVLSTLAQQFGFEPPGTLESLDRHLAAHGWRPPSDMLIRLARWNPWLQRTLSQRQSARPEYETYRGLAVFFVREKALERGGIDKAIRLIEQHGFHALRRIEFAPEQSRQVAGSVRGGNWGRGPWTTCGGLPVAAVVVFDTEPVTPTRWQKRQFPLLDNARLLCKSHIRDRFNGGFPHADHTNVVHSSDNSAEALEYLRLTAPEVVDEVLAEIIELRSDYSTDTRALATWTKSGRRAKIELVYNDGRLVVKKTFKPHQRRFCEREAAALSELSKTVKNVPRLLAAGSTWLVIPFYDDVLRYKRSSGKLLPLGVAKQAIAALRSVYEAGYAVIDASIDNILVDRCEGLKLIDFEFCYRYRARPRRFEDSYDIVGCPPDFDSDLPIQGANTYDRNWKPYVGLSLRSLLHDPTWLQHTKRVAYFVLHFYRFLPRLARHYAGAILRLRSADAALNPAALPDLEADRPQEDRFDLAA